MTGDPLYFDRKEGEGSGLFLTDMPESVRKKEGATR